MHIKFCRLIVVLAVSLSAIRSTAQTSPSNKPAPATNKLFLRRYAIGETSHYRMKASNRDRSNTVIYEVSADSVVKKDSVGRLVEEYTWANLVRDGKPVTLPPEAKDFRQVLSLEPNYPLAVPDLRGVLALVGPITDLLTFYADMSVAQRGSLKNASDHFYSKFGKPNSWADGTYVLIGQDSIDFDVTLEKIDLGGQVAALVVRHVRPAQPEISLPAQWMHSAAADAPNNWVQVTKSADGKYNAEVGKETFEVHLKIDLRNGKILSGTIDNPVEVLERDCSDAALQVCGDAVRYQIRRTVELD